MSGMAGNVTAFNTVWTYDIYQRYIRPAERRALSLVGRLATVVGVVLSVAAPTSRPQFNNIMDMLPAACSPSSMRRCSRPSCWACSGGGRPATARSTGLLAGTLAAVVHHGLTLPSAQRRG